MSLNETSTGQHVREVFIVRLWRERKPDSDWNGQVQHVSSGDMTAIRNLDDLLDFFQNQLDVPVELAHEKSKLK